MNNLTELANLLFSKNIKISTVESCTGGLLSSYLTDIPGSSSFITLNLVTYSNEAKQKMLNVSDKTLKKHGAVSEECAYEMAKGLFNLTNSDICISTTGIAGPTGGTVGKPVGLMYSTIYCSKTNTNYKIQIDSNLSRQEIKEAFVKKTITNLISFINENY